MHGSLPVRFCPPKAGLLSLDREIVSDSYAIHSSLCPNQDNYSSMSCKKRKGVKRTKSIHERLPFPIFIRIMMSRLESCRSHRILNVVPFFRAAQTVPQLSKLDKWRQYLCSGKLSDTYIGSLGRSASDTKDDTLSVELDGSESE